MIKARRIGHATFETPDLNRSLDYYTNVAGLVLNSKEKDRAFFASKIGPLVVQLERGQTARCKKLSFEVSLNADFSDMPTDQSGLTSTSTRTVIIEAATAATSTQ